MLFRVTPTPAEEEVEKHYKAVVAKIQASEPKFPGVISIDKSVKDQLALLDRLTPADTGRFIHPNGDDANGVLNY